MSSEIPTTKYTNPELFRKETGMTPEEWDANQVRIAEAEKPKESSAIELGLKALERFASSGNYTPVIRIKSVTTPSEHSANEN